MSNSPDEITLLRELLFEQAFFDQSALLEALRARGHAMTQSTLSRKLKLLGVQKKQGRYLAEADAPVRSGLRLLQVQTVAPNLLILKTEPGHANAFALRLDQQPLPGQAGTIAGDDTIFVAIKPEQLLQAYQIASRWL